jgi:hypothetical protein
MASEVKYKKDGGNSSAVNGCSNNRPAFRPKNVPSKQIPA